MFLFLFVFALLRHEYQELLAEDLGEERGGLFCFMVLHFRRDHRRYLDIKTFLTAANQWDFQMVTLCARHFSFKLVPAANRWLFAVILNRSQ